MTLEIQSMPLRSSEMWTLAWDFNTSIGQLGNDPTLMPCSCKETLFLPEAFSAPNSLHVLSSSFAVHSH